MFIRRGSAILRSPDPDPAAGGGGGGGEALTEAQTKAIGAIVNSAVTTHLSRIDFGAKVTESLGKVEWAKVLTEPLKTLIPQTDSGSGGGGDDDPSKGKGGGKGKGGDPALEQQLQKLATDLENERKARTLAEQATKDAETKRQLDRANAEVRNALQPKLRDDLLSVAVGHFGKSLKLDDKGNALLSVKKAPYKGAPEEDMDVPLAEGLPILLASVDMKPFLPPPGGGADPRRGGTPSAGGGRGAPALDSKDPADRVAARLVRG